MSDNYWNTVKAIDSNALQFQPKTCEDFLLEAEVKTRDDARRYVIQTCEHILGASAALRTVSATWRINTSPARERLILDAVSDRFLAYVLALVEGDASSSYAGNNEAA